MSRTHAVLSCPVTYAIICSFTRNQEWRQRSALQQHAAAVLSSLEEYRFGRVNGRPVPAVHGSEGQLIALAEQKLKQVNLKHLTASQRYQQHQLLLVMYVTGSISMISLLTA